MCCVIDQEFVRKLLQEEAKQKSKSQSPHHQADEVSLSSLVMFLYSVQTLTSVFSLGWSRLYHHSSIGVYNINYIELLYMLLMQELARRLQQQEVEARKRQKQQQVQQQPAPSLPGEDAASLVSQQLVLYVCREVVWPGASHLTCQLQVSRQTQSVRTLCSLDKVKWVDKHGWIELSGQCQFLLYCSVCNIIIHIMSLTHAGAGQASPERGGDENASTEATAVSSAESDRSWGPAEKTIQPTPSWGTAQTTSTSPG